MRPTIKQARSAYGALRHVDTADHTAPDGATIRGTHAFRGNTRIRLAAVRLMGKLEAIYNATQDDLEELERAVEAAESVEERRAALARLTAKLNEPLDDDTFAEVDPERFGLRTSAMGLKVIDRVPANIWKDMGPWFVQDVPDDELTEDGAASRADRRSN